MTATNVHQLLATGKEPVLRLFHLGVTLWCKQISRRDQTVMYLCGGKERAAVIEFADRLGAITLEEVHPLPDGTEKYELLAGAWEHSWGRRVMSEALTHAATARSAERKKQ